MSEPNYYGNVNLELLRWIPLTASRVLEIGCGEAALAAAYRTRNPAVEYTAVETHAASAVIARERVDRLMETDFMAMDAKALSDLGRFDAIVLGDVLEHLPDPWKALKILCDLLTDDGRLAVSVPNVAHWTALANLTTGTWPAHDSGLFDRTHLRFFTLSSLQKVLTDSALSMERVRPRLWVGDRQAAEKWLPILSDAAERAGENKTAFMQRAQTLQYVASAHRADFKAPERLHIHFAALAPRFMDVRTSLPAESLESDPSLTISYREKSAILPDLAPNAPKVAVLQRLIMQEETHWRSFVAAARQRGWLLVYEIDDHPDLIGQVHAGGTMSAQLRTAITRGCHAVQTSTARLQEALLRLNPEVAVFKNSILELKPFQARDAVRKVFFGALNRESFSRRVAAALAPAIDTHPQLEFVVVHDQAFFDALPTTKKTFKPALPYAAYLAEMVACDVVLSPLEGVEGERFKSDIKFLEAARCGAAMIASPCVYEDSIEHGVTGLIARDLADWPACLSQLVDDPALRNVMAKAAWMEVRRSRMMSAQVAARGDWYRSLYGRRADLDAALLQRQPTMETIKTS